MTGAAGPGRARRAVLAIALTPWVLVACAGAGEADVAAPSPRPAPPSVTPSPPPDPPAPSPAPVASPAHDPAWVVRYRVEVGEETGGLDPAEVTATVADVLADARGWTRAGFVFVADGPAAPPSDLPVAVITVAEGDVIDARCRPYDTYGRYSCQLGPTVNLNADRWRQATPEWTAATGGDLTGYRTYLINHEVGHLLGLHHPRPQCPGEGYPAPIMLQQSTELAACTANPWPLTWEVELAASRIEPFAPGYEPDPEGRPSPPAARS